MPNISVVGDMRKVLQDFLAPELRSVHARLDAMDEKLEAQAKVTDARLQEVLVRIDATNGRIDNLKTSIETRIECDQPAHRRNQRPHRHVDVNPEC
jgi:hypothetical protein